MGNTFTYYQGDKHFVVDKNSLDSSPVYAIALYNSNLKLSDITVASDFNPLEHQTDTDKYTLLFRYEPEEIPTAKVFSNEIIFTSKLINLNPDLRVDYVLNTDDAGIVENSNVFSIYDRNPIYYGGYLYTPYYSSILLNSIILSDSSVISENSSITINIDTRNLLSFIDKYIDDDSLNLSIIDNSFINDSFVSIGDKIFFSNSGESFFFLGIQYYYNSIRIFEITHDTKIFKISIDFLNETSGGGSITYIKSTIQDDIPSQYTITLTDNLLLKDSYVILENTIIDTVKNEFYPEQWLKNYNNENSFDLSSYNTSLQNYFNNIYDILYFSNSNNFYVFNSSQQYNFDNITNFEIEYENKIYKVYIDFKKTDNTAGGGRIEYINNVSNTITKLPTHKNYQIILEYQDSIFQLFNITFYFEANNDNSFYFSYIDIEEHPTNTGLDNSQFVNMINELQDYIGPYTFNESNNKYEYNSNSISFKLINGKYYVNFYDTFKNNIPTYSDDSIILENNNDNNFFINYISQDYIDQLDEINDDKDKFIKIYSENKFWVIHKNLPTDITLKDIEYSSIGEQTKTTNHNLINNLNILDETDIPNFTINSNSQKINNNNYYIKNNLQDLINSNYFTQNNNQNINIILKLPNTLNNIQNVSLYYHNNKKIGNMTYSNNYYYYTFNKDNFPIFIDNFTTFNFTFIIKKYSILKPINILSPQFIYNINKNNYLQLFYQNNSHTLKIRDNTIENININKNDYISFDFKNYTDSNDYNILLSNIKNHLCNIFIKIEFQNSNEILYQYLNTIYIPTVYLSNYNINIKQILKYIPIDSFTKNSLYKKNIYLITQYFNFDNTSTTNKSIKLNFNFDIDDYRRELFNTNLQVRFYNTKLIYDQLNLFNTEYIIFFKQRTFNKDFNTKNFYSIIHDNGFIPESQSFKSSYKTQNNNIFLQHYSIYLSKTVLDSNTFFNSFNYSYNKFNINIFENIKNNNNIYQIIFNNLYNNNYTINTGNSIENDILSYVNNDSNTYTTLQNLDWFIPGNQIIFNQKYNNNTKNIIDFVDKSINTNENNIVTEDNIINNINTNTKKSNVVSTQDNIYFQFTDINGLQSIVNINTFNDTIITYSYIYKTNTFAVGSLLIDFEIKYNIHNFFIDTYNDTIPLNEPYEFSQDALRLYSTNNFNIYFIDGDYNEYDLSNYITKDDTDTFYQFMIYDDTDVFNILDFNKKYTIKISQHHKNDIIFNLSLIVNKEYDVLEGYTSDTITINNTLKLNLFLHKIYLESSNLTNMINFLKNEYNMREFKDIDLSILTDKTYFITSSDKIDIYFRTFRLKNLFNSTDSIDARMRKTTVSSLAYGGSGIGYITITDFMPCFTANAQILTPFGYKFIKDIEEGDLVKTDKNINVPVVKKMIRKTKSKTDKPYLIPKNKYGKLPLHDIYISPQHAFKIKNKWTKPSYTNLKQVHLSDTITYYNLELPEYKHNLICSGITCESWSNKTTNFKWAKDYNTFLNPKKKNINRIFI
jgi:hypothetical protein